MSGVTVLTTSSDSSRSEEITSRLTARESSSGPGTRMPLMLVVLSAASRPRTTTKRPSPWSRSSDTPGRRCRDSATFWSGNWPIASAETIETRLSEACCWLSAAAWPAACPITRIVSSVVALAAAGLRVMLPSEASGSPTSMACCRGLAPTYSTCRVYSPAGRPLMRKLPSFPLTAWRFSSSTRTVAPPNPVMPDASVTRPVTVAAFAVETAVSRGRAVATAQASARRRRGVRGVIGAPAVLFEGMRRPPFRRSLHASSRP